LTHELSALQWTIYVLLLLSSAVRPALRTGAGCLRVVCVRSLQSAGLLRQEPLLQEAQAEQRVAPAACGAHLHRMQSAPTGSARASSSVNGSRRSRFANVACRLGLSRAELTWRRVRATRIGTARGLNFRGTAARWLERRGAARLGSARLGSAQRSLEPKLQPRPV